MSEEATRKPDPIAETILALLQAGEPGASISPVQAAQAFAAKRAKPSDPPDLWRRYLAMVRQQGIHLARSGQIVILRKGEPVDPSKPIKGVVRWALPRD
jgi:hypothetical protein